MTEIRVPKLNNNDVRYALVEWLVEEGTAVTAGTAVAVVETSKAAQEITVDAAGVLHQIAAVNDECEIGAVIGRLFETSQHRLEFLRGRSELTAVGSVAEPNPSVPVLITDPARTLAAELGIDESQLRELGQRVVRRPDVVRLASSAAAEPGTDTSRVLTLPRSQQAVARVVARSHATVPTAFLVMNVDVDAALAFGRTETKRLHTLIGLSELLIAAVARRRTRFPTFFAERVDDRKVRLAEAAHIGITIDVGTGLFVVVIREADRRDLADVATTLMELRSAAIHNRLREQQLSGANVLLALSSDADVLFSQPIVLPGTVCAVSLGGVRRELAPGPGGTSVCTRAVVSLGIAYDHRLVNGQEATQFVKAIADDLRNPGRFQA